MSIVPQISPAQIRHVLTYSKLVSAMESVLASFSSKNGEVVQPLRPVVNVDRYNGRLCVMPSYSAVHGALATKLATVYPDNKDHPRIQASILLHNPTNGQLLAVMDGDVITEMRTAAVSAVSAKYLARPGSSKLCILGAGVQGYSHCEAINSVLNISETRVYSRTFSHAKKLAEKAVNGQAFTSAQEAVKDADVIAVTLFTDTPVLFKEWVKPGCHIISIGATGPEKQEIDPELMRSSVVYVDCVEAAMTETGDVRLSGAEIYAEIGDVISGTKEARYNETTVFKSKGLGCEDAASAKLVWDTLNFEYHKIKCNVCDQQLAAY